MDQNHPIPQQISSYQFRLVGDMTLKQFFQLAGGVLIALLFYALPLHPLIKGPFMVFFVLLGVALAFFPIEERPLERWIVAFFRSIYSPTLFSWGKNNESFKYFQDEGAVSPDHQVIAPQGEAALNAYLATPNNSSFFSKLENSEKTFLSKVGALFGPGSPKSGSVNVAPTAPAPVASFSAAPIQTSTTAPTPTPTPVASAPQPVSIPETEAVSVPRTDQQPRFVVEENTNTPQEVSQTGLSTPAGSVPLPEGQQVVFSPDAAPPSHPQVPNTLSGQVLSPEGKIIEGAILEVRDISGRPVRASKTNKLGHFYVVTPLLNGSYEIITEKDGFEFTPMTFEAAGALIPPIAIRSLRKLETPVPVQTNNQAPASPVMQI